MATKAEPTRRGRSLKTNPAGQPRATGSKGSSAAGGGGARPRRQQSPKPGWVHPRQYRTGRSRYIKIRLLHEEYQAIASGAASKGLTPTGFVAEAALAAVDGAALADYGLLREALAAALKGGNDLVKVGVNLNQAVAKLNATGEAPRSLADATTEARLAIKRHDRLASEIQKAIGRIR